MEAADNSGYTALMIATEQGCTYVVQMLMQRGANMEARTEAGGTVFDLASCELYELMERILSVRLMYFSD
ncbi:hypothetical protein LZ30DRAFT_726685 [Colletotrichum cereale]|nr:hypothetical protein LZ30DRAFT_726685 [Colletotrichum cereale]